MRPNRTVLTKKRTPRSCLVFVSLRFIFRFFDSSVADACVPPYGRFPRSLRSLGMTNYTGGSGVFFGLTLLNKRTPVPPRRAPQGGRLNRLRTRLSFRGISREIPRGRNGTLRTCASPLACGGSPPRNSPRDKRYRSNTNTPDTRPRRLCALPAVAHRREIPRDRNGTPRTRASQMPARAPCRAGPLTGKGSLPFYRNSSERRDSTSGERKSAFTAPSSRTIAREAT